MSEYIVILSDNETWDLLDNVKLFEVSKETIKKLQEGAKITQLEYEKLLSQRYIAVPDDTDTIRD